MNEKPKRGVSAWVGEKIFDLVPVIIVGVLGFLLVALLFLVVSYVSSFSVLREKRENAPCAELSAWTIDDLPVRCFEYYGLQVPEHE